MSPTTYGSVKRAIDVAVSLAALVLLLPVMLLIAIAILVDDGYPVLFRQPRAGKDGATFEMLKFRTMGVSGSTAESLDVALWVEGVPDEFVFKTSDVADARITRVGRWLRRTSLDEVPQFINVLRGEMSLVGPRPELLSIAGKYNPNQARRLSVLPGVTGWAQVTGRAAHSHGEKVAADLYYVNHASLSMDLLILGRTIMVPFHGRHAV